MSRPSFRTTTSGRCATSPSTRSTRPGAHGVADYVGSLTPGWVRRRRALASSLVRAKPDIVLKDGVIAYANTGHGNASTVFGEPTAMRPMFGAVGDTPAAISHIFVAAGAMEESAVIRGARPGRFLPVRGTRKLTKADMLRNDACPDVRVDKDSFEVSIDGQPVRFEPARSVPLNRLYWLG